MKKYTIVSEVKSISISVAMMREFLCKKHETIEIIWKKKGITLFFPKDKVGYVLRYIGQKCVWNYKEDGKSQVLAWSSNGIPKDWVQFIVGLEEDNKRQLLLTFTGENVDSLESVEIV